MYIDEFCKFFDFTFDSGDFIDEYGDHYKYIATDDQGCFVPRFSNNILNFRDMFESMEADYIVDDLEYNGFEYNQKIPVPYYEQAYKWLLAHDDYKYTDIFDVVSVFAGHDELKEV